MIVNEIFYSLQGEGSLAGVPSVFIRLSGCPLRCKWCDTKYAWAESAGEDFSVEQIVRNVQKFDCASVVITGGEPMINDGLAELAAKLKSAQKHITIETAGIVFATDIPCNLMSISPKLNNAGAGRLEPGVIRELIDNYDYQLKFVVENESDIYEINELLARLDGVDKKRVMLMPQAKSRCEYIAKAPVVAEICKKTGFVFCPRLQVLLWDNAEGS
ncbi:MAG: radical SAM protein [Planctomycetes bacterium]|nr:radical SAM protein [Planctomycetota bacterium]